MSIETPQPTPILSGKSVRLRPPLPTDIADRQRCGHSGEYARMVGGDDQTDAPLSEADAQSWYHDLRDRPYTWLIEWQGHAIGGTFLHQVDFTNRRARYAIGIFDASCWGQGLGTEVTGLVLGYAFDTLKLHRVDLLVLTYNQRAIRAYTKAGFVQEGIEREGAWIAGKWESDLLMSILEHEYHALYS